MVAEIKERLTEELDYRLEARNQQRVRRLLPRPPVHPRARRAAARCPPARVLTTELVTGATWQEMLTWDQHERDLAGECLFRFVFRSLYGMHPFNGDPHPGNYLFHGDGKVTFLDFGLVKHFTDAEMATFVGDGARPPRTTTTSTAFRAIVEAAGMLRPRRTGRRRRGRRVLQPVLRERAHRRDRHVVAASTPAASSATRSTAPARSRSTRRCRRRSCSSSASTSACTRCSASCTPPATTGASPRSCGRSCRRPAEHADGAKPSSRGSTPSDAPPYGASSR